MKRHMKIQNIICILLLHDWKRKAPDVLKYNCRFEAKTIESKNFWELKQLLRNIVRVYEILKLFRNGGIIDSILDDFRSLINLKLFAKMLTFCILYLILMHLFV